MSVLGDWAGRVPRACDHGRRERGQFAVLQAVAYARKRREGGRPSVSGILRDLVDTHMKELRKEAGRYLD